MELLESVGPRPRQARYQTTYRTEKGSPLPREHGLCHKRSSVQINPPQPETILPQ